MDIGNTIGKTLFVDPSFKYFSQRIVVRVLVSLYLSIRLVDCLEVEVDNTIFLQPLDYYNIPFMCIHSYLVRHVFEEYKFFFIKQALRHKRGGGVTLPHPFQG